MDWAEFAEVMRLAGVSEAATRASYDEWNRAAKLQQDREKHWEKYTRGTWQQRNDAQERVHRRFYSREGSFDYTYTVPDDNMSDEFYEKFTGHKRDYADYVAIPGLPGWSAPSGYNKYSTGPMAGSHTIITKDMKVNNHSAAFETIPFKFIPPELF